MRKANHRVYFYYYYRPYVYVYFVHSCVLPVANKLCLYTHSLYTSLLLVYLNIADMPYQSRNWAFTLNNYTDENTPKELPKGFRYIGFSKEIGEKGTPHLQGVAVYGNACTHKRMREALPGAHIDKIYSTFEQAREYCLKQVTEGNPFIEFGDCPKTKKQIGNDEKARWRLINENVINGNWDLLRENEPMVVNIHLSKLQRFKATFQPPLPDNDKLENYWIWGPPETGKSYAVRHWAKTNGGLYNKDCHKWWCGYDNQPNVLIDDFNPEWVGKHRLKTWVDHYEFPAEIKGGNKTIRPTRFFVTSNYSLEHIFGDDPMLLKAIKRRFTVVHKCAQWRYGMNLPACPFTSTKANAFDALMANAESSQSKQKILDTCRKRPAAATDDQDHNDNPIGCYIRDHPKKSKIDE